MNPCTHLIGSGYCSDEELNLIDTKDGLGGPLRHLEWFRFCPRCGEPMEGNIEAEAIRSTFWEDRSTGIIGSLEIREVPAHLKPNQGTVLWLSDLHLIPCSDEVRRELETRRLESDIDHLLR